MKKTIALLLSIVLLLALVACGTVEREESVTTPSVAPTVPVAPGSGELNAVLDTGELPVEAPEPSYAPAPGSLYESKAADGGTSSGAAPSVTEPMSAPVAEAELAPGAVLPGGIYEPGTVEPVESRPGDDPVLPVEAQGQPFVLTAAEWRDNDNWPFFLNLVNSQRIAFPAFGVDPRNRVKVDVHAPFQTVTLEDEAGNTLWTAKSDAEGIAYLFYREGETPTTCTFAGVSQAITVYTPDETGQGAPVAHIPQEVDFTQAEVESQPRTGMQILFIVDTTGSMGDELAYLQSDFLNLAGEIDPAGVTWSFNFYKDEGDEYVTRVHPFSDDLNAVRDTINAEYAAGGGDEPEAVKEILAATLPDSAENGILWEEEAEKLAFLIFDAPPHAGTDQSIDESIRWAAERGIHLIPLICSGTSRDTELFGRAIAIVTDGTYLFLTDDSGVGFSHLEPIVGSYAVEILHDLLVRIINSYHP